MTSTRKKSDAKKTKPKTFLERLGPGFITGASDDDPSGIATYSQTGAQFGYTQLWTTLFTLPFMIAIQEMCGRIGLVTGMGLSAVIRKHYPRPILYASVLILLVANTINIGADLGAMASAMQLLVPLPFVPMLIGMTILTLALEIFVAYPTYAKILKYLTFSLLAYVATTFIVKQPWGTIGISTILPSFSLNGDYLMNIVALLGTTISPYLFFWQADEEVEEEIAAGKLRASGSSVPRVTRSDIRTMRIDTVIGMVFSNVVTFFIIATAASTLGAHGIRNIETADQAAQALAPLGGEWAFLLFAFGIVGTGLLAVPVLAGSASYAVAEALKWNSGLSLKLKQAHGFYGVLTIATVAGLLINFTGIPPFKVLYYTAMLNGMLAPPLMVLILMMSNNKKIMGKRTNSVWSNVLGWMITVVMGAASAGLLWSFI
jgi:NRAMP (natural resistance-associated macrophage protein)-like metal ion transporter